MTERDINDLATMYNDLVDSGMNAEQAAELVDEEMRERIQARRAARLAAQIWAAQVQIASARAQRPIRSAPIGGGGGSPAVRS